MTSAAELLSFQEAHPGLVVLFFWAEFHEPCKPGGQMDDLVSSLAAAHPAVAFAKVCLPVCVQSSLR